MTIINHEIEISCDKCGIIFHKMKAHILTGMTTEIKVTPHTCKEEEEEFNDFEDEELGIIR